MLKISTILTMGVAFTMGIVLGLMIHLPGTVYRHEGVGASALYSHVNKRSVPDERPSVVNYNSDHSASIAESNNSPVFIRHINADSVKSRVNKNNNRTHRRKTNSKQPGSVSKQIWRIKQAEIATSDSFDNKHRVERTRVINLTRSFSEDISGHETGEFRDENVALSIDSAKTHLSQQQSDELTKDVSNDGPINDLDSDKNINTDSNMADGMSVRFTELSDIVNGVYWSPLIESRLPNLSDKIGDDWSHFARNSKIVKMEEGCGRMQNRLVTFQDSSQACVRYRINTDQIQGDFFSFLLSLMLGLDNVPRSVLSRANIKDNQWKTVSPDIIGAQWNNEKLLVLSQFVPDLSSVYIPTQFRNKQSSLVPSKYLKTMTFGELHELAQWSDLILFDYLTGNLDRVVNNMFNQQWNKRMMEGVVHNLEKTNSQGKLIFLDNESGLFHSYRLLDNYQHFHKQLLSSLCIFRKNTVYAIRKMRGDKNLGDSILELLQRHEPVLHKFLPKIPQHNVNILQERMQHILDHVSECEGKFGVGSL